jgi:hypothetical protein
MEGPEVWCPATPRPRRLPHRREADQNVIEAKRDESLRLPDYEME